LETNLRDLENCKKELEAVLTYEELKPHFDKALENYRKKVTLPGFRKGKAPLGMIKKMYGDSIEYSALEDIASEVFSKYIIDNKVELIDRGSITDLDYQPKDKFTFKVEFEVRPDIRVENYKGLELSRKKYIIDDSLIDEEINYHKFRNASLEMDGQALDSEYVITADVQNLDQSGNIIIGESQKDAKIYLGNKELFPEFKEGLAGIKEGEERVIETKDESGGVRRVRVTANRVDKLIYPEMDKDFFKKVTGKDDIETEDDFRKTIKTELEAIYSNISEKAIKNDAVNELIKLNDVTVPDAFVEAISKSYLEDYKKQLPKGHKLTNEQVEEFKKNKKVDAILQAKWFLLREKLAEVENIQVSDEDYLKAAEENSKRFNIPADKLAEVYKNNNDLTMQLLNDKVIDFLIQNANVTEKEEVKNAGSTE
jgi:trigger factor